MKTLARILLACMMVFLVGAMPGSSALARGGHGGHGGHVGIGVWLGPGWWGVPVYPSYYYPYYQEPPIIIQQQPEEYVQPAPQEAQPNYWYYCRDAQGYYPYVQRCPGGWMKVVPTPPPPSTLPPE